MVRVVVCDDNPAHAGYAEDLVRAAMPEETDFCLDTFTGADVLLQKVMADEVRPDIAVLNLAMESADAVHLADELHLVLPSCRVIYLTSFALNAADLIHQDHVWEILKAGSAKNYLPEAMEKAVCDLSKPGQEAMLCLHSRGKTRYIPAAEVLYLERNRHSTIVIAQQSRYVVATHPDELVKNCPEQFIHCHQSFWVNSFAIAEMDKNTFILADGTEIAISRTFRDTARKRFLESRR